MTLQAPNGTVSPLAVRRCHWPFHRAKPFVATAALATVVSAQSGVTKMFARDLAAGNNPEAIYTKATVEAVAVHGCRASLTLELYYPGGVRRTMAALDAERAVRGVEVTAPGRLLVHYESAWVAVEKLTEVARDALEADPHNPAPVTLRYGTPLAQNSSRARRVGSASPR